MADSQQEELDYGEDEAALNAQAQDEEPMTALEDEADQHLAADASEGAAPGSSDDPQAAEAGGASPPPPAAAAAPEVVPEEWQVMDVPEGWRPQPMIRVWGLPQASTEQEVADLLASAELEHAVRSVVFDPKQATAAGKVALVRFHPPPLPLEPPEPDTGKLAEGLIAALRAKQLELHGTKINVEKTGAEVTLFLANLRGEEESDEGLRATCEQHGALERCFVVRNATGDSKHYAFAEFTLPAQAAACKEAWNKAGEAQRQAATKEATAQGERFLRIKMQRAEAAPIKTVGGLFATVLYVDNMSTQFIQTDALRKIFSEYGEVSHCYMPRSTTSPNACKGFAFVQFKHSFAADAAYRALDMTEQPGIGKLLISFSNPVKANDPNRPGSAGGSQQRQPYSQQQQRTGAPGGGRGGGGLGAQQRSGVSASGTSGGYPKLPAGAGMASGSRLPGGKPPPPPGPPPPSPMVAAAAVQQQQQQQAAAMQAAMQQRLAMQQMLMMQQQQRLAMQQIMVQQAAQAEELRQKEAELEAKAKADQQRKAAEAAEAEEKARREAEYAARLQYGFGAFGGMPSAAGMGAIPGMGGMPGMAGFAGNPMAAMAASMAGLPGFAAAFGGGLGGAATGGGGLAALGGSGGGAAPAAVGGQAAAGGYAGGSGARYGGSTAYGSSADAAGYGTAGGAGYGGGRVIDNDAAYGGRDAYGSRGGDGAGSYDASGYGGGGAGGGAAGGSRAGYGGRGGGSRRDDNRGSGYGDSYPPKRPRY